MNLMQPRDFEMGLIKSAVFGFLISVICASKAFCIGRCERCRHRYDARGGAIRSFDLGRELHYYVDTDRRLALGIDSDVNVFNHEQIHSARCDHEHQEDDHQPKTGGTPSNGGFGRGGGTDTGAGGKLCKRGAGEGCGVMSTGRSPHLPLANWSRHRDRDRRRGSRGLRDR